MKPSQHIVGIADAGGTAPVAGPFPRGRERPNLRPVRSPWWDAAPWLALLLIIVGAVRLHELVPPLRVLQPALLVTIGGGALLLVKSPPSVRRSLGRHPLMRLVFAYWLFMVATLPLAIYSGRALGVVKYFLPAVVLLAAVLVCAPTRQSLRRLQLGTVLATAVYAAYVLLFGTSRSGRLDAGLGAYDSNDMAALLGLMLPLALGLIRTERRWVRLAVAGAAVLFLLAVIASGSRGGALGLGAGAIVYVLGLKSRRRFLGLGVLAVATLLVWNFSPSFQERMSSLTNLEDDYNTTHEYGRKAVWKRGRQYIRENPIIGVGAGNFPDREGLYFAEAYSGLRGGKWSTAHNAYVQAFAELGILGGSLFVAILLYGVRHAWRLWRGVRAGGRLLVHRPEFLAGLAAYLVSGIFLSHAYFLPMVALLALTAMASASAAADRKAYRAYRAAASRQVPGGPGARSPTPVGFASRELAG